MKIERDDEMNPRLRAEVQGLRGDMLGAAERVLLPGRFEVTPSPDVPALVIRDTTTGRTAEVPLYAYRAARQALSDLFGEQEGAPRE